MTFEEKSKEALEASEILKARKKYNSCINRAYYSAYQNILYKLDNEKILKTVETEAKNQKVAKDEKKKGSHEYLIDFYLNNILFEKEGFKITSEARKNIYDLKTLRHKADYRKNTLTESDINDAIRMAKSFNSILSSD